MNKIKEVCAVIIETIGSIINKMGRAFVNFFKHFAQGDKITKLSYVVMGAGCFLRGQKAKGFIYLGIQVCYILFMILSGGYYLSMLPTLGTNQQGEVWNEELQIYQVIKGDNSMLLLLFGVSVVLVTFGIFILYLMSVNTAYKNEVAVKNGEKLLSFKEEWNMLFNEKYHITVLALPVVLTFLFNVLPLIFTICIAFTNYDKMHQPPGNLFTWVGFENFTQVLYQNPLWATTFMRLLTWTLIWAFFATFLNYIFGMLLAMLINKKGIYLKKMWRTIFVITIAVPQFVSLLLMSKLLNDQGSLNNLLISLGWIEDYIPFLTKGNIAKITVIVINCWVGIPYSMLITSGILMNIPQDLYEASKIDGAGPIRQFFSITLPYMLHVTTPYLITQFMGNINNFNVIYLLTAGDPKSLNLYQAGETDLLVTWLYKLTVNEQNYALAATIGIIIFLLLSFISLVTYNNSNAVKGESDFQ